ncbi:MAG: SAVED domain-containing protein [Candidatus Latescibacterota bacterium]
MPIEVTRYIKRGVERELWARAAGRCQFDGCNRVVYKSPVTQGPVNISDKAHIYSFSKDGPRGWGPFKENSDGLNDTGNLMLVCHDCHKKVDREKDGGRYQAPLLIRWKEEHEKRIAVVTGVDPGKKSYVVLYGANIGEETSVLQPEHAKWALFPKWYPAEERSIALTMTSEGRDEEPDYWSTKACNLERGFERQVRSLIADGCHFSIFGFAPMPLLIRLGALFTDKVAAQVYQLQREPKQTWQWSPVTCHTDYTILEPDSFSNPPALIISLSATIARERITSVLGPDISIWELTINQPHNDFLKTTSQLSDFRKVCRKLMVLIANRHGNIPSARLQEDRILLSRR